MNHRTIQKTNTMFSLPSTPTLPTTSRTFVSEAQPKPSLNIQKSRLLTARCSSRGAKSLASEVGKEVEALLQREENRPLLEGLEEASRRVNLARQALADIQRQEDEAARSRVLFAELEKRKAEIDESQRELLEARTMVEKAGLSLSSIMNEASSDGSLMEGKGEDIDRDAERWESIKVAALSAAVGTLASLPISFYHAASSSELVKHLLVGFVSCALFGVTFRYTIRRDLDNIHLKTGVSGAFGVVKGFAAVEAAKMFDFDFNSFTTYAFDGAVCVSESIIVFLFAAVALDYCFKMKLLCPFPIKKVT